MTNTAHGLVHIIHQKVNDSVNRNKNDLENQTLDEQMPKDMKLGDEKSTVSDSGNKTLNNAKTHKSDTNALEKLAGNIDTLDDKKGNDVSKMCQL